MTAMIDLGKSWFDSNFLEINDNKTERICFSLRQISGEVSEHVKLLGVTLDTKLTWGQHTNNVISKLARVCFLLRKLKKCVSSQMLLVAYYSFFHAHLIYANILWGNSSGAKQVLVWQKKALRILFDIPVQNSCKPFFIQHNIITVPSIFILQNIIFIKQNLNHYNTRDVIHSYQTRGSSDLDIPSTRLSKFLSSHKYLQIKFYNKIPLNFRNLDLFKFKIRLTKWLTSKAFYSVAEFLNCDDFTGF